MHEQNPLAQYTISFFKAKEDRQCKHLPLSDITQMIQANGLGVHVSRIRNEPDKNSRNDLKRRLLPFVTTSGIFDNSHAADKLIRHSGLIQIDFDNVPNVKAFKAAICKDPYTFVCFTSPSGTGVKLIVRIPPEPSRHPAFFAGLQTYYRRKYKQEIDEKCKDVSRVMFLSHDPELFTNEAARIFEITGSPHTEPVTGPSAGEKEIFDFCLKAVSKTLSYTDGNRNTFVCNLAYLCNEYGLSTDSTIGFVLAFTNDPSTEREHITAIRNAFSKRQHKHGSKQYTSPTTPLKASQPGKQSDNGKTGKASQKEESENRPVIWKIEEYLSQRYQFRYNSVANRIEYREGKNSLFTELNEDSLYIELLRKGYRFSKNVLEALLKSSFVTQFDPMRHYFESLPLWDMQTDYIQQLASHVQLKERERC